VSQLSRKTLGLLSDVASEQFTHDGLDVLLMVCDIDEPLNIGGRSKQRRLLDVVKSLRDDLSSQDERALSLVREVVARLPKDLDEREQRFVHSVHADGWDTAGGAVRARGVSEPSLAPQGEPVVPMAEAAGPGLIAVTVEATPATAAASASAPRIVVSPEVDQATSQRVFIVHGRDQHFREVVARFVERQQYQPVILAEQVNQGRTLFEKLLDEAADAAFAVAILSPEDLGGLRTENEYRARARQNVIFELGYFVALLGRKRVVALVQPDVEIPSDIAGLLYIEVRDDSDAWKMQLAKEMKAAGLVINFEII
jgi:predicted nucleotide-binding protein